MAAAAATTLVVTAGLQPIEKKLTMDQMLQERGGAASDVVKKQRGDRADICRVRGWVAVRGRMHGK